MPISTPVLQQQQQQQQRVIKIPANKKDESLGK